MTGNREYSAGNIWVLWQTASTFKISERAGFVSSFRRSMQIGYAPSGQRQTHFWTLRDVKADPPAPFAGVISQRFPSWVRQLEVDIRASVGRGGDYNGHSRLICILTTRQWDSWSTLARLKAKLFTSLQFIVKLMSVVLRSRQEMIVHIYFLTFNPHLPAIISAP